MDDRDGYTHVLYHDDLAGLTPGAVVSSHLHKTDSGASVNAVSRGLGKYLEIKSLARPVFWLTGQLEQAHYRIRAVIIPLAFEQCEPQAGICGVVAAWRSSDNYVALVICRDRELRLLECRNGSLTCLANAPVDYCIGQPLTLTLTVRQGLIEGMAGPYSGAVRIKSELPGEFRVGDAGLLCAAEARFGPFTVECRPDDLALHPHAIEAASASHHHAQEYLGRPSPAGKARSGSVPTRIATVPLNGLVSGENLQCADVNGDGEPEFILAQHTPALAASLSLTRLTCLSVLSQSGALLWQAGISAAADQPTTAQCLPFKVHALYGDPPVVVCVFGYDVQIRDGKTGRLLASGKTPETHPVGAEFRTLAPRVVNAAGARVWGDEILNMDAARLAFCDTLGNGAQREIMILDALHNLAVLDAFAEPALTTLFQHRGNLGGAPVCLDLDGDGKEEILAGCSLLDDDGTLIESLPLGGAADGVITLAADEAAGLAQRVAFYSADFGFYVFNASALIGGGITRAQLRSARVGSFVPRTCVAGRFAPKVPGEQFALLEGDSVSRVTLLDHSGSRLWTREFNCAATLQAVCDAAGHELILVSWRGGFLTLSGANVIVHELTDEAFEQCVVLRKYRAGNDTIAAFNAQSAALYSLEA